MASCTAAEILLLYLLGIVPLTRRQCDDGVFVAPRAHLAVLEDLAFGDPGEGLLEHLLGVGLEDDALAGAPAPRVHAGMEALGELGLVVVRVELGPQVDVALRPSQRAEELADVLRLR